MNDNNKQKNILDILNSIKEINISEQDIYTANEIMAHLDEKKREINRKKNEDEAKKRELDFQQYIGKMFYFKLRGFNNSVYYSIIKVLGCDDFSSGYNTCNIKKIEAIIRDGKLEKIEIKNDTLRLDFLKDYKHEDEVKSSDDFMQFIQDWLHVSFVKNF